MKLGLALGGGGARGAAHIGVLKALERLGIKPDLITGTSAGGVVGALLAADYTVEEMIHFFQQSNMSQMFAMPTGVPAFSGNSKIERLLEETFGQITFADLKIPLSLVTADLVSRKEVILDEGDLISALLATTALPILLPPVERDKLVLVDGGILNNVPFDIARARGATTVIAVALSNTAPYGTPSESEAPGTGMVSKVLNVTRRRPTFQILSTVADIITEQSFNARLAVSQPELLLRPKLGTMGLFDFHNWEMGVKAGEAAVEEVEDRLIELMRR